MIKNLCQLLLSIGNGFQANANKYNYVLLYNCNAMVQFIYSIYISTSTYMQDKTAVEFLCERWLLGIIKC